ncbi:hypothetical protein FB45DRAFT_911899 [Roridomyces roridus]|uniref:Uncharacterized protein n=1 Tax=Roridomyces roridus TaxID=1738132 RepID=A0AAD7FQ67_9AGAR|nr:hypothetical protein FB45DRAFT_911899 [Roridomyces roridus]
MSLPSFPPEKWTDSPYIVARTMKSSFGLGALCGLPLYAAIALKRRVFSVERLLNVSTLSGIGASAAGGVAAYSQNRLSDPSTLRQRRMELVYSANQRREDDFGTIGAILGLVLFPAVFYTRAGLLDLTLGGGSLGYAGGYFTHRVQNLLGNSADKVPEPEVPADDPRLQRR